MKEFTLASEDVCIALKHFKTKLVLKITSKQFITVCLPKPINATFVVKGLKVYLNAENTCLKFTELNEKKKNVITVRNIWVFGIQSARKVTMLLDAVCVNKTAQMDGKTLECLVRNQNMIVAQEKLTDVNQVNT